MRKERERVVFKVHSSFKVIDFNYFSPANRNLYIHKFTYASMNDYLQTSTLITAYVINACKSINKRRSGLVKLQCSFNREHWYALNVIYPTLITHCCKIINVTA